MSLTTKILSDMKSKSPWWIKIPLKITLSRLPVNYSTWSKIGYFKHGYMMDPEYAFSVFQRHYDNISSRTTLNNYTVLEMGVGDSLFTAIAAHAFGANMCYLIDTSDYANRDINAYWEMIQYIYDKELPVPNVEEVDTLNELLIECNACYQTKGLESLRSIPDKSVDFIFSQAVFEHIRKQEFPETLKELRRIITDKGICSHSIDLKDHLGGNLNSLRFTENIWESDFFVKSGFYTNRIRFREMLELFYDAGFRPEVVRTKKWSELPTSKEKLTNEFKFLSNEELKISEFDVLLFPA